MVNRLDFLEKNKDNSSLKELMRCTYTSLLVVYLPNNNAS